MHTKHADSIGLNQLSGQTIGCGFTVLNALGAGGLEKIYENALALELRDSGLTVVQQFGITVCYKGTGVGEYFADLLVDNQILVELKAASTLDVAHRLQCVNYLKATNRSLCLLLNFGKTRLEIKCVICNL